MSTKIESKNYESFLSELFLFKELSQNEIHRIITNNDIEVCEFDSNEKIYTPNDFKTKVGFLISGECSVEKLKPDGSSFPLNKLIKGDSFGILAVFSENKQFPTMVKVLKPAKVMFFSRETIISLIKEYPEVALAIISFMSNRIEFLNKKVATFSADSVEEKFAFYILNESKRTNSLSFSLNLTKTAKALNAGRASVYRAIDALQKLGIITLENKKIYISDLQSLERITK